MKKLLLATVVLFFAVPHTAEARPRHYGQRHHQNSVPDSARLYAPEYGRDVLASARAHIGQTAREVGVRRSLWCSAFLLKIDGDRAGVNDKAISWLSRPRTHAAVGKIVVLQSRRKHVGVVSGFDANGNPIVISGNHGNRVAESVYPKRSVIAYVEP